MSNDFLKPVLAIDSSLSGCVVGVLNPESNEFYEDTLLTDRDQSAKLVPMVCDVLKKSGLGFSEIGLIVTTTGPGSFTGLRIGMTVARTLGLSLGVPVQGIDTMTAMIKTCANDVVAKNGYACVLETKRGDFYFCAVEANFKTICESLSGSHGKILGLCKNHNLVLCGDATERFLSFGGAEFFGGVVEKRLLDAQTLCHEGLRVFIENGKVAEKPYPVYLRDADVSISTKPQRKINNLPI